MGGEKQSSLDVRVVYGVPVTREDGTIVLGGERVDCIAEYEDGTKVVLIGGLWSKLLSDDREVSS